MPRYIDADALREKIKYSMLVKMGYLNDCADMGREIPEDKRARLLAHIDWHENMIKLIDNMPTVTINDNSDDIKVTNCNHIADDSKKVASSCGHENGKDVIYRQDAIEALDCINGVEEVLKSLPPAQPRLPRWAQKVEKYHEQALTMPHIKKHRAWALYQAYKEYNRYGK